MNERIYGKSFDNDPNTRKQNTSVRFTKEGISVSFSHSALRYVGHDGEDQKVRTNFFARENDALYPGLSYIHNKEASVLPNVIHELSKIKSEQELTSHHTGLIDHVISGLSAIVHPEGEENEDHLLTRRPHPRTSSEIVDTRWFDVFNRKKE